MISFLLYTSSFFNFTFFIFAVGFVIALGLEQVLKFRPLSVDATMNERNMMYPLVLIGLSFQRPFTEQQQVAQKIWYSLKHKLVNVMKTT